MTQLKPTSYKALEPHTIIQIATGDDHFVALASTGHVFTCGNGEQNQLGRKITQRESRVRNLEDPELIDVELQVTRRTDSLLLVSPSARSSSSARDPTTRSLSTPRASSTPGVSTRSVRRESRPTTEDGRTSLLRPPSSNPSPPRNTVAHES